MQHVTSALCCQETAQISILTDLNIHLLLVYLQNIHLLLVYLLDGWRYCLIGLLVRHPPQERKTPGSNPVCAKIFPGSSHTSDFKIGTPEATLPGAWRYRVSAATGQSGVSIL